MFESGVIKMQNEGPITKIRFMREVKMREDGSLERHTQSP